MGDSFPQEEFVKEDLDSWSPSTLQSFFRYLDADHDGFLSMQELRVWVDQFNDQVNEEVLDDMIRFGDPFGNGQISEPEFLEIFSGCVKDHREILELPKVIRAKSVSINLIPAKLFEPAFLDVVDEWNSRGAPKTWDFLYILQAFVYMDLWNPNVINRIYLRLKPKKLGVLQYADFLEALSHQDVLPLKVLYRALGSGFANPQIPPHRLLGVLGNFSNCSLQEKFHFLFGLLGSPPVIQRELLTEIWLLNYFPLSTNTRNTVQEELLKFEQEKQTAAVTSGWKTQKLGNDTQFLRTFFPSWLHKEG